MKKRLISILLAAMTAGMLTGCGGTEQKQEQEQTKQSESAAEAGQEETASLLKSMDVESYVTLGEYKNLPVTVDAVKVEQSEVNELVDSVYFSCITEENGGLLDRKVEVGDTVNIDYVGKKDDVAFDGGTAQGALLEIGSGQYIEGFEEGLVGVMPGETVDLELTFPEEYMSEELAGEQVVFSVTVNFIMPTVKEDGIIAEMGIDGVTNEMELREYAYNYLYTQAEKQFSGQLQNAVMNAFMQNCTISDELPQELVEKYEQEFTENIQSSAAMYGVDADTYTNYYYGTDFADFVSVYSKEAVKQDLALQALANRENISITDDKLDKMLLETAQNAGYTTAEEYLGDVSKEEYREYYLLLETINFLVDNAAVTEN